MLLPAVLGMCTKMHLCLGEIMPCLAQFSLFCSRYPLNEGIRTLYLMFFNPIGLSNFELTLSSTMISS